MTPTSRKNEKGFTLVEVMAAVTILGIGLISLILAINRAKETAFVSRNLRAVRNLASQLMGEIENGKFETLYDGMNGNFASEGYPEFEYQIGVGDESTVPASGQDMRTEDEKRRDALKAQEEANSTSTNSSSSSDPNNPNATTDQPTYQQVIVRVSFKSLAEEPNSYVLMKKISNDIVEGKFQNQKVQSSDESAQTPTQPQSQ